MGGTHRDEHDGAQHRARDAGSASAVGDEAHADVELLAHPRAVEAKACQRKQRDAALEQQQRAEPGAAAMPPSSPAASAPRRRPGSAMARARPARVGAVREQEHRQQPVRNAHHHHERPADQRDVQVRGRARGAAPRRGSRCAGCAAARRRARAWRRERRVASAIAAQVTSRDRARGSSEARCCPTASRHAGRHQRDAGVVQHRDARGDAGSEEPRARGEGPEARRGRPRAERSGAPSATGRSWYSAPKMVVVSHPSVKRCVTPATRGAGYVPIGEVGRDPHAGRPRRPAGTSMAAAKCCGREGRRRVDGR